MKTWSGWKSFKLTRELAVNLAAVEIILNMREKMEAMQQQIEGFIETLNQELSQRAAERVAENHTVMPVIQINPMVARSEAKRVSETRRRVR
jgi:MerR family transcriptional regulator, heat shock protein HspR